jgi:hypothetical protein
MTSAAIGRRGQGKSTLGYSMALQVAGARRSIYDPRGMFKTSTAVPFLADEDQSNLETVVFPEFAAEDFSAFCSTLKSWIEDEDGRVRRVILIDEIRFVDLDDVTFDWLVRCSHRSNIQIILTAHRPTDVPPDIRAILDCWCVFHTTHKEDLDRLQAHAGDEFRRDVQTLGPFQFLAWDDSRAKVIPYRDPSAWYVDISRPATAAAR